MRLSALEQLFAVAQRKNHLDQTSGWSQGSSTYFTAIKAELDEVEEELRSERQPHLEEELSDVLWDYFNLLLCLEREEKIDLGRVFERAVTKFDERVSGLETGISWAQVKKEQKQRLEHELLYGDAKKTN